MEQRANANWPGLAEEVLSVLRCPSCQGNLTPPLGGLECLSSRRKYPLVNGVARFVEKKFYTGSFGFQWLEHDKTQLDNENSDRSEVQTCAG